MIGVLKKELFQFIKWLIHVQQNSNPKHLIFMELMKMKMNQL